MIEEGDRIMVCLSGGKDSYTMLEILRNLQKSAPISFSLVAVNLDQKQPWFPEHILPAYLEQLGLNTRLSKRTPTASSKRRSRKENHLLAVLSPASRHPLSYRHRARGDQDRPRPSSRRYPADAVLNMFYGGKMKGMPPKLMSDDGKHIVIRPLAYCREKDIERFSRAKGFPIIPCNLCGSQPNLQRQVIADMLRDWDKRYPGRIETMFSAMQNVVPSHLSDVNLFDFKGITHGSEVVDGGDLAFDREDIPLQPAGWQPEEEDARLDELRLNVVEVK